MNYFRVTTHVKGIDGESVICSLNIRTELSASKVWDWWTRNHTRGGENYVVGVDPIVENEWEWEVERIWYNEYYRTSRKEIEERLTIKVA